MTTHFGFGRSLLALWVLLESALFTRHRARGDRGQATAEYALVVLGAAAVAMLLIAWATSTGKLSTLLNKVVDSVAGRIT
ncbi:MAG: DUF4244 domain-containing protein [Acidimicrobiales bacterium]